MQKKKIPALPGSPASKPTSLEAENHLLRTRLEALLKQARDNERIMQRHHSLNLKLISSNGLVELLETIFGDMQSLSSLDAITLMVFDPEYELRRMFINLDIDIDAFPYFLLPQNAETLPRHYRTLSKPELGLFNASQHKAFYPDAPQPKSLAIMPLYRNQQLIGYLNFGSDNPYRFSPNVATDFIEEQAAIIAICLENVINNERLKHIGLTDPLTGVHNRRYIETRLTEEIRRAQRHHTTLSSMYIDIDYFKQINDRHGHQLGDEVLREIASRIKSELRLSDALGRLGGEEFIVLLIDTDASGARQVAERIRSNIASKPFALSSGETCHATVSIGLTTLSPPQDEQDVLSIAQRFLGQADVALYQAKGAGRNRVIFFN